MGDFRGLRTYSLLTIPDRRIRNSCRRQHVWLEMLCLHGRTEE
jgi:hypothetical protein